MIFIGSPIPIGETEKYRTLSFNIADNIAQNTMIEGLHSHYSSGLKVISELSDRRIDRIEITDDISASVAHSSRLNRVVYYISLLISYTKLLNRELKKRIRGEDTIVITRGSYVFIALPVLIARLRYRNIKWVPFIITTVEVPEYGFPFNIISMMSRWTVKQADAMIAYVAKTAEDYLPGKPFQEIVYTIDDSLVQLYKRSQLKKKEKFTITYTGSLSDTYNFSYIIDAIKKTGDKYHWVFAGTGVYGDRLEQLSRDRNYNVDYLGSISNVEAIKLQQSSSLLLCPRGGNLTKAGRYYTKYAASGKLIEYLCSGTPILATDVPSTNRSIQKYMTPERGQTVDDFIRDIESIEYRYKDKVKVAQEGQKHAFKYFNAKYQNEMIYRFLESL